uniref:Retrovirus-related Pol polyprotein from transposon 17.6 n=1 Tax=Cajanus cajan TaxID=3821 RepID=A0A151SGN0_CAJCA|nr:Retrovirus-related Pol polyprotein from transposon 17.6 [Cajanus cajan]
METPLPHGWKPLHLDRYDGTTDPDEHIDLYTTQVNLYTNNDAILCRVFPTSLKGAALNWYTQLPAESIDNFHTLVRQFMAQYATSRPHHVTSATLASLCQGEDESLRAFMERFANISVKIQNLNPEVALHAMLIAFKPRPFIDNLYREAPRDMEELCARATSRRSVRARPPQFPRCLLWYNQIMMYPPDEVHTSFITDHANYCNRVMPFGLKNAGATYQRLMDKVFHQQIGRNMEVYVDDMVVKTTSATNHAADLAKVFVQIRRHNIRLNPEKCVFGVQGGKFLGFMITSRGIEANPEKCKAIIQMQEGWSHCPVSSPDSRRRRDQFSPCYGNQKTSSGRNSARQLFEASKPFSRPRQSCRGRITKPTSSSTWS